MTETQTETLTFLFTDIEGSTRLWEQEPEAMRAAVDRHDKILRSAIDEQGGRVFRTVGDAICAVFTTAPPALNAAVDAQRSLHAEDWPTSSPLRVRVVLHTTAAEAQRGDYVGAGLNRIGRLLGVCHGGQTLLTQATQQLVRDHLPDGATLLDLGQHRFRDMVHPEEVFQLDIMGLPSSFSPLRSGVAIPNNLPPASTPFVGRETDLSEMTELLDEPRTRLVTIVGPGGMGKTRLALAAGELQLRRYEGASSHGSAGGDAANASFTDGVYLVALAPLHSADQIVSTVAQAIGYQMETVQQTRTPQQQLFDYLRNKHMLLILDNFEHLLGGSNLVTQILQESPSATVLATSRERLQLRNEQVYAIQGLEYPDWETPEDAAEYSAVQLFVQSAQRVQSSFELVADDLTYLTRICRLVGGMPLGLELAASWVDILPLAEIAREIQESFDFLETEMRDVPERQRSMRAVFDYTWQRLSATEKKALAELSVFRGGFDRHAAREVAGASIRVLAGLVSKSLLQVNPERSRYIVHELVRQFAAEELAGSIEEVQAACDRHSVYYLHWLATLTPDLHSQRQQAIMDEMAREQDNLHHAWSWAIETKRTDRLAESLECRGDFYVWFGQFQEGADDFDRAQSMLAHDERSRAQRTRARLLTRQAAYERLLGNQTRAEQLLEHVEVLLHEQPLADEEAHREQAEYRMERAALLNTFDAEYEKILTLCRQSLALFEQVEDSVGMAECLYLMGNWAHRRTKYQEAESWQKQCLAIRRKLGSPQEIALSLAALGFSMLYLGRFAEAEVAVREACDKLNKAGNLPSRANALSRLAGLNRLNGNWSQALAHRVQARTIYENLSHVRYLMEQRVFSLHELVAMGSYDQAQSEAAAILASAGRETTLSWFTYHALEYMGQISLARGEYRDAISQFCESRNNAAQLGQIQYMRTGAYLSLATRAIGDAVRARGFLVEALEDSVRTANVLDTLFTLPVAARIVADSGNIERAAELNALANRYPILSKDVWWLEVVGRELSILLDDLPDDVRARAAEKGRSLGVMKTVVALLDELA